MYNREYLDQQMRKVTDEIEKTYKKEFMLKIFGCSILGAIIGTAYWYFNNK